MPEVHIMTGAQSAMFRKRCSLSRSELLTRTHCSMSTAARYSGAMRSNRKCCRRLDISVDEMLANEPVPSMRGIDGEYRQHRRDRGRAEHAEADRRPDHERHRCIEPRLGDIARIGRGFEGEFQADEQADGQQRRLDDSRPAEGGGVRRPQYPIEKDGRDHEAGQRVTEQPLFEAGPERLTHAGARGGAAQRR